MRGRPFCLLVACAASASSIAGSAAAQQVTPEAHKLAETHFLAGRELVEKGDCARAIPHFIESIRNEPNVGARFNLAECSAKANRIVDAWNQYKVAEQLALEKGDQTRHKLALDAALALQPKVTRIRLAIPGDVKITAIRIDGGDPIPEVDYKLLATGYAVEPNQPHHIRLEADDRAPVTLTNIQGIPGEDRPATPVTFGPPLHAPSAKSEGSGQRTAGLVIGGVGVAGLAVGAVAGLIAMGKNSDYNNALQKWCPSGTSACNPAGATEITNARTDISGPALISTIGFIAGGALLATGAVVYFTAPHNKEAPPGAAARLHLAPAVGPGMSGAVLGGAF